MSHRERTRCEIGAHFLGELQEPDVVRDRAAVLADRSRDLILRQTEFVGKALVRSASSTGLRFSRWIFSMSAS